MCQTMVIVTYLIYILKREITHIFEKLYTFSNLFNKFEPGWRFRVDTELLKGRGLLGCKYGRIGVLAFILAYKWLLILQY